MNGGFRCLSDGVCHSVCVMCVCVIVYVHLSVWYCTSDGHRLAICLGMWSVCKILLKCVCACVCTRACEGSAWQRLCVVTAGISPATLTCSCPHQALLPRSKLGARGKVGHGSKEGPGLPVVVSGFRVLGF